jgi:hypothetical protein
MCYPMLANSLNFLMATLQNLQIECHDPDEKYRV